MNNHTFSKLIFTLLFSVLSFSSFAQKLLDPAGSGGPISIVTATSSGVNSSIAIAYSIRQIKTTYDHSATITPPAAVSGFTNSSTPLLRARRSSDNGQLDIGYDVNGNLDTVTLKNFVTNNGVNPTASGFVTVWYDQSGNSRDAYQTNTSQQFRIVNSGLMERSSSGQIGFGGVSGGMLEHQYAAGVQMNEFTSPSGINIYGIDSNRTLNVVSQPKVYTNGGASDGSGSYLIDRNGSTGNQDKPLTCIKATNNNWTAQIRNISYDISSSFEGSIAISTSRSDNVTLTRTGNLYSLYVNGVFAGSRTLVGENKMTPVRIGYGTNTGENVYYGEFTLFPSSLSSNDLNALNNSQGNYFVLGTPTNTWTGATSNAWATGSNWSNNAAPDALSSVIIPSGTPNSPTLSTTTSIKKLTINNGATFTNSGSLSISDSMTVNGTYSGSGTIIMNGGVEQIISGTTTPIAITNLTISNTIDTVFSNNNLNISGTLSISSGAVFSMEASTVVNNSGAAGTISGSGTVVITRITSTPDYQSQYKFSTNTLSSLTLAYLGAGAQNINLGLNHNNLTIGGTGTKTISAAITSTKVTGNIVINSGTLSNGGFAIAGAAGKTLTINNSGVLDLGGTTSAFPTVYTISLSTSSTVTYSGSGAQTISAQNYGNLTSSNSGARTLANSGTIGIAGSFTEGTNSYTITGSTISYNGTGAQTISAFNYNNLTIAGTRVSSPVITLETGTIGVAGTFSITATGVGSYAVTGNTVKMSGTAQTVPSAITYNNLTISGSGAFTTTSVAVNGIYSQESAATLTAALTYGTDATLQYNTSTSMTSGNEWPATFAGTGGVVIKNTGIITLSAAKTITFGLALETGAQARFNAVTTHTAATLTLAGVGQVSGTWGGTGSGATNTNSTFFGASVTGRITINTASITWTGTTSTAWATGSNWSGGSVPTTSTNVIIPSAPTNQPNITTTANVKDLTIQSGAVLTSSGTINIAGSFFNSGTANLSNSPINILGTSNQNLDAFTTTGTVIITNANTTTIDGVTSVGALKLSVSGLTMSVNNTLNITGILTFVNTTTNSNITAAITGAGTINCGSLEVGDGSAAFAPSNTTRTHTLTSTISNLNITGNLNINSYFVATNRIRNGVFTHTSGTITIGGSLATLNANASNTSTYTMGASSPVLNLTGATPFSISGTGTSTTTLNGTGSVVNYAGSSSQTARGTTYITMNVNNTAGVTLGAAATITTLNIGNVTSNSIFNDGGFTITPGVSSVLNLTSGTYNLGSAGTGNALPAWGTLNISAGTTIGYVSGVSQTVSTTPSYKNLTLSGAGAKNIATATTLTVSEGLSVTGGTFTLTGTAIANITGNITTSSTGSITMGSGTLSLTGSWDPSVSLTAGTGTINYNGTGAQTIAALNYNNLTVSGARTGLPPVTFASGTIGVSSTFTFSATGFNGTTFTGNTFNFNGTGAQTIAAINYNNLTISGARTGSPTITFSSGTVGIAGTFTNSATGVGSFSAASTTFDYNGSGAQTIIPFSYTNLTLSGTRSGSPAVTLGSGTINVSGTFTNSATGVGSYVNTGNTFVYNGTGAQTICPIDYNNLTISTARTGSPAITWGTGTVGIAGTLSITATGIGSHVVTGNTIDYEAASGGQSVLATFNYNNLNISNGAGTNTAAGNITVGGTLTTTASSLLDMATNTLTVSAVSHAGTMKTQSTSGTPFTSGLTWGGTVEFNGAGQTIPSNSVFNNLTCSGSGTKTLGGSITVSGTLNMSSASLTIGANTLTLNGDVTGMTTNNCFIGSTSSNISIGGTGSLTSSLFMSSASIANKSVQNFTINRTLSGAVSLGDTIIVKGNFTPTAGTLTTSGRLVIGSDASSTGNILSGSGSISGNVRVQRFIPALASTRRFRFLASPMTSATIGDWKNEIHVTGVGTNFDATSANKPSVYSYTESTTGASSNGWVAFTDGSTTPLRLGGGYRVFVRGTRDPGRLNGTIASQDAVTLDLTGTVNTSDLTLNSLSTPAFTYTVSGGATEDGWNLLGNPFASSFDWNAFHDAGRTLQSGTIDFNGTNYNHVGPIVYIYNGATNSYASFNANGDAVIGNLTGGIIPSGSSFFVQTAAASPSITLKESFRVSTAPGQLYKRDGEFFSIQLISDSSNSDEAVIKYNENATDEIDGFDIPKMYGPEVNIASITKEGKFLSANIKPISSNLTDTIPLSIGIANSGDYSFRFKNISSLIANENIPVSLVDKYEHTITDLRTVNEYKFNASTDVAATWGNERFSIVLGLVTGLFDNEQSKAQSGYFCYPTLTKGNLTLQSNINTEGFSDLRILDITGKTVLTVRKEWNAKRIELDLCELKSGSYFIEMNNSQGDTGYFHCIKL